MHISKDHEVDCLSQISLHIVCAQARPSQFLREQGKEVFIFKERGKMSPTSYPFGRLGNLQTVNSRLCICKV